MSYRLAEESTEMGSEPIEDEVLRLGFALMLILERASLPPLDCLSEAI